VDSGRLFAALDEEEASLSLGSPAASGSLAAAKASTSAASAVSEESAEAEFLPSPTSMLDPWLQAGAQLNRDGVAQTTGSLRFGAETLVGPTLQRTSSGKIVRPLHEERMVKKGSTAKIGRRGCLTAEDAAELLLADTPSAVTELKFLEVVQQWERAQRQHRGPAMAGIFAPPISPKAPPKSHARGTAPDKEKGMWVIFMDLHNIPPSNPGRRHAASLYSRETFKKKVDRLYRALDSSGTGLIEYHEFAFFLNQLRGRMHCFLRNAKEALEEHADIPPPDQEFVLSGPFKASLTRAIQEGLFTWRKVRHAWALDRRQFRNLVELVLTSAISLVMDRIASQHMQTPVTVDFCLLMEDGRSPKGRRGASDADPSNGIHPGMFCRTVFNLHTLCPPQGKQHRDGTIDEGDEEPMHIHTHRTSKGPQAGAAPARGRAARAAQGRRQLTASRTPSSSGAPRGRA